jgi:hypothetical protein
MLKKTKTPKDEEIIVIIDESAKFTGKEGLVITDKGIHWSLILAKIDEKKKESGFIPFEELANTKVSIKKTMTKINAIFTKMNIKNGKMVKIELPFSQTSDSSTIDEIIINYKKMFELLIEYAKCNYPQEPIPDEKNAELIAAFIGDDDIFYQKAFAKYSVNGVDRFAFAWSWSGVLAAFINLFHRKLYLLGFFSFIISLGGTILFSFSEIILYSFIAIYWAASAIFNPFFVYRRYRSLLSKIGSTSTIDKKKESLAELGGTNKATSILLAIVFIVIILYFVMQLFGISL